LYAIPNKNPLLLGYMGTLEALKAKHAWNPYNKIKYVSRSLKTMHNAILQDPDNLEIRFMRFSIEHYTPAFLGFSKNLNDDREAMIAIIKNNNYGTADFELSQNIIKFLIESNRCTPSEIQFLKTKI
jgi:hypothetical protein